MTRLILNIPSFRIRLTDLQAVAVRSEARETVERVREMALIGEAARQRDLCEGQSRNREEMLGASHADLSHVPADGAAEMLVKLPAASGLIPASRSYFPPPWCTVSR